MEFHLPVIDNRSPQNSLQRAIDAITQLDTDIEECEQLLMNSCAELLGEAMLAESIPAFKQSKTVTLLLEQIEDCWDSPLSLNDMAMTAQLSRYQTLRHFQSQVGMTPHAYLTQHRVKQAKRLIEQGMSLIDTALYCGFADQSHMTRVFKRQFGVSPGKICRRYPND